MIYTTAEYIGMALLLVGFLALGVALMRLDRALTRDVDGETDADSQRDFADTGIDGPPESASAAAPGHTPKAAPRSPGTRRSRRKHGR